MSTDYSFEGWMGLDKDSANGKMVWQKFPDVEPFLPEDVDIQITHCGICMSDIHTLRSGWGETPYPVCVGHEIVGKAVRVGDKVKGIKVGDRIGVGAQSLSCLKPECAECATGNENLCQDPRHADTFGNPHPDGGMIYGGYADYKRVHHHFAIPIPESIPSNEAAPMLCGGVTTYSPLKQHGAGPGKSVGIVGIGGLGHFGLLWAKGLGSDKVTAISRTGTKKADAMKMGADTFIATDEDKDWAKKHADSLDIIVCTVSSPKLPLEDYLKLLKVGGTFVQVGAPEDVLPQFNAFSILPKQLKIAGSLIGSPSMIKEMLALYESKKLKGWIQDRPMKDANQAIVDVEQGKARYRITLVNEKHA